MECVCAPQVELMGNAGGILQAMGRGTGASGARAEGMRETVVG